MSVLEGIDRSAFDADEILIWTIMRTFEVQALEHYLVHAPQLAQLKHGVGAALLRIAGEDGPMQASILGPPMTALVESAGAARNELAALVVQGLVLERVRQAVYATLMRANDLSPASKTIAQTLESISRAVVTLAPPLFAVACDRVQAKRFAVFAEASDHVLHDLDAVGEGVDELFGPRFGLRFADIVGDFVSDLVPVCVGLGMERRKVLSHLAGALMGI